MANMPLLAFREIGRHGADIGQTRRHRYFVIALLVLLVGSVLVEARSFPLVARTAPAGLWVLAALAVLADTPLIANRWPTATAGVLTSVTFCFAISYEWGGYGAGRLAQALAILVAAVWARRGFWPTAFDLGRYGLALAAAGSVVTLIGRPSGPAVPDPADLHRVLLAAVAWYLTFRLLSATGTWLNEGATWTEALTRDLPVR